MIIVGELINASRKTIGEAIKAQDEAYIQKVAKDEFDAGANYIDVNEEPEYLRWLVNTVQEAVESSSTNLNKQYVCCRVY